MKFGTEKEEKEERLRNLIKELRQERDGLEEKIEEFIGEAWGAQGSQR